MVNTSFGPNRPLALFVAALSPTFIGAASVLQPPLPGASSVGSAMAAVSAPEASASSLAPVAPVVADAPQVARLKADALYTFLTYVELPASAQPSPDAPLVIGVTGADEVFAGLAEALQGRTIQGRQLLRRRLAEGDALQGVHLLFVGRRVDWGKSLLVKAAKASPIVLVSETAEGLALGAVFNLLMVGDRLRFEASLEAADRAALRISSRVLSVAERVTGQR